MLQIVVRRVRWRPLRQPSLRLRLARIFHSLCHRHDHSPAGGFYDGDSQGICGLSPDVPASALGPRIVHSLHAGYRVECETSGLGRPSARSVM
jgi:hypothetical protein